ncbi:hypothetical protein LCGC14_2495700, partial [marine sediment metagenome]
FNFYYLADPKDKVPKYVGVTFKELSIRLSCHISEAKRKNPVRKNKRVVWIRRLLKEDCQPIIILFASHQFDDEDLKGIEFLEGEYITRFKALGAELLNGFSKGMCSFNRRHTEETKRRISKANSGRRLTLQTRERIRQGARRVSKQPETKVNRRMGQLGRIHPEEELLLRSRSRREKTLFQELSLAGKNRRMVLFKKRLSQLSTEYTWKRPKRGPSESLAFEDLGLSQKCRRLQKFRRRVLSLI